MKLLMALILTALFSTVAMADDFKGDRVLDETVRAEFKAQREAIKELPAEQQKDAMKTLRSDRRAAKKAALEASGLSPEEVDAKLNKKKKKKKGSKRAK